MKRGITTLPTARFVWLAAMGLPLALLGLFGGAALVPVAIYDAVLVVMFVVDLLSVAAPRHLSARRELPASCVQGKPTEIRLLLTWLAPRTGFLQIREMTPTGFAADKTRFRLTVRPGKRAVLSYTAVPRERGRAVFGPLTVRSRGPLGLVARQSTIELSEQVRVYPDLLPLAGRESMLTLTSAWAHGLRRGPMAGEGREFHQLRAYALGDDVRLIDWKGYARRGRPIVREYRAERNQRVLLLVDGGRLMTVMSGGRSRFDWAMQAAGQLGRVALAMGDLVGAAVFSREIKSQVPASRGPGQLGRLSDLFCLAQADNDEPDLQSALHFLLRRHPRRTLVVLFSEAADPRAAEMAVRSLGRLAPRHLGLMVTMADADLDAARELPIENAEAAYRRQAAEELWLEYRRTASALESRGVMLVRARADALAAAAVQRYLEVKTQGRL